MFRKKLQTERLARTRTTIPNAIGPNSWWSRADQFLTCGAAAPRVNQPWRALKRRLVLLMT